MNANNHIDVEDLAMLAMSPGSREPDAEAERAHLANCPLCREELARIKSNLALYALATPLAPLPAGSRDRFLARLGQEARPPAAAAISAPTAIPAAVPTGVRVSEAALRPVAVVRRRSAVAVVMPWLGWAVAAGAVLVAYGLHQQSNGLREALTTQNAETARLETRAGVTDKLLAALKDPRAVRVNLVQPKAQAQPAARASYDAQYGTLLMQASSLAPLPANKVYELWVIPANGTSPIPAGVFRPDDHGNAVLLQASLPTGVVAKAFGITVEHAGGSATPTMPILLAGTPG